MNHTCTMYLVPGLWYMAQGMWHMGSRSCHMAHGTSTQKPSHPPTFKMSMSLRSFPRTSWLKSFSDIFSYRAGVSLVSNPIRFLKSWCFTGFLTYFLLQMACASSSTSASVSSSGGIRPPILAALMTTLQNLEEYREACEHITTGMLEQISQEWESVWQDIPHWAKGEKVEQQRLWLKQEARRIIQGLKPTHSQCESIFGYLTQHEDYEAYASEMTVAVCEAWEQTWQQVLDGLPPFARNEETKVRWVLSEGFEELRRITQRAPEDIEVSKGVPLAVLPSKGGEASTTGTADVARKRRKGGGCHWKTSEDNALFETAMKKARQDEAERRPAERACISKFTLKLWWPADQVGRWSHGQLPLQCSQALARRWAFKADDVHASRVDDKVTLLVK